MSFISDIVEGYHAQKDWAEHALASQDVPYEDMRRGIQSLPIELTPGYRTGIRAYNLLHPGETFLAQSIIIKSAYNPALPDDFDLILDEAALRANL